MKVRIAYTVEVPDSYRRAINVHYGLAGLATRKEVQSWFITFGESMDDDIGSMLDDEEED